MVPVVPSCNKMFKLNYFSQLSTYVVFSVPDPYVFVPLESGSVIICMDPDLDPSINKQKFFRLTIIFTVLLLSS
jgi:hypothetical protein